MSSRILIVDDEQEWQETFKEAFTSVGCPADSAPSTHAARELLRINEYKLLILDIFLSPGQAPLVYQSFLGFMAREYPEVEVVAVTGKQLRPDEAFALSRLGVSDFIYKPRVQLEDLRRLARRILDPAGTNAGTARATQWRLDHLESLMTTGLQALNDSVAEVTELTRAVIRLASADVTDCPRLFTLVEVSSGGPLSKATREKYLLTLWCEAPGAEHSWDPATYKFSVPRDWLQKIAPYGLLVSRILSIAVPVAASLPGIVLSGEDFQRVQYQLEFMKEIATQLPPVASAGLTAIAEVGRLSAEEGAGLRALRAVLLAEDNNRVFGDLRKRGTEDGDIIWVCPGHHRMLRGTTGPPRG